MNHLLQTQANKTQKEFSALFDLLKTNLALVIQAIDAQHMNRSEKEKDQKAIHEFYSKIQSYNKPIDNQQAPRLSSLLQQFLKLLVYPRTTSTKNPDPRFSSDSFHILTCYHIEGILYNSLCTLSTLYPLNEVNNEGELISWIGKKPFEEPAIALSYRLYTTPSILNEYSPLVSFNDGVFPQDVDNDKPMLEMAIENGTAPFAQDQLKILWLSKQYEDIIHSDSNFLLYSKYGPGECIVLTNSSHDNILKKATTQSLLLYILPLKYLDFYVQLAYKNYSIRSIAVLSRFLLSKTKDDINDFFQQDNMTLPITYSRHNYPVFYIKYDKKQVQEIYTIAQKTGYPLNTAHAIHIKNSYQTLPNLQLVTRESATIQLQKNTKPTVQLPKIEEDTTQYLTKASIGLDQRRHSAQFRDRLKALCIIQQNYLNQISVEDYQVLSKAFKIVTDSPKALGIGDARFYASTQQCFRLSQALRKLLVVLDQKAPSPSITGEIYNTLLALCALQYGNQTSKEKVYSHHDANAIPLVEPGSQKKIVKDERILMVTGCYFNHSSFKKLLCATTPKETTNDNPALKRLVHSIQGHSACTYQSIYFEKDERITYFGWRDMLRVIHQMHRHPTIPVALYHEIKPLEKDDIKPSEPQPFGFLIDTATKTAWPKTGYQYLTYEHLDSYSQCIKEGESLEAMMQLSHKGKAIAQRGCHTLFQSSVNFSRLPSATAEEEDNQIQHDRKLQEPLSSADHKTDEDEDEDYKLAIALSLENFPLPSNDEDEEYNRVIALSLQADNSDSDNEDFRRAIECSKIYPSIAGPSNSNADIDDTAFNQRLKWAEQLSMVTYSIDNSKRNNSFNPPPSPETDAANLLRTPPTHLQRPFNTVTAKANIKPAPPTKPFQNDVVLRPIIEKFNIRDFPNAIITQLTQLKTLAEEIKTLKTTGSSAQKKVYQSRFEKTESLLQEICNKFNCHSLEALLNKTEATKEVLASESSCRNLTAKKGPSFTHYVETQENKKAQAIPPLKKKEDLMPIFEKLEITYFSRQSIKQLEELHQLYKDIKKISKTGIDSQKAVYKSHLCKENKPLFINIIEKFNLGSLEALLRKTETILGILQDSKLCFFIHKHGDSFSEAVKNRESSSSARRNFRP